MRKLVELLDTVYIAEHFAQDVTAILEEHKELDLAGAKLTPRISGILLDSMRNGVVLRNTESVELDMILQENMRRLKDNFETKPMPLLQKGQELAEYIRTLSPDVVYRLDGDMSLLFPVAVLIQIYAPNIQIDFGSNTARFFRYITETLYRKNFDKLIQTTDTFVLFVGDSYREVTITEKDMSTEFHIEGLGMTDWYRMIASYYILPSYFGAVKTQRDESLNYLWEPVVKKALADIEHHFESRKMTIKDFLKGDA